MGGACGTNGGEVHTGFWWGDQLQDKEADGRIILKWIFKKWYGEAWTRMVWLRKS